MDVNLEHSFSFYVFFYNQPKYVRLNDWLPLLVFVSKLAHILS